MTESATSRTRRASPPPLRFEGEVAYIDLTRGREAVVDHEDATRVDRRCWSTNVFRGILYAQGSDKGLVVKLHNFILPPPLGFFTRALDRNYLNCRKSNLVCVAPEDHPRRNKLRTHERFLGVFFLVGSRPQRWQSVVHLKGGSRRIVGVFPSSEDAARARDDEMRSLIGKAAFFNFPRKDERGLR